MNRFYGVKPDRTPYSNDDKIIIYEVALKCMQKGIKEGNVHGLCHYMALGYCYLSTIQLVDIAGRGFWSEESIEESLFPELMKYKPETNVNYCGSPGGIFWFALDKAGMQRRVDIITEILTNLKQS